MPFLYLDRYYILLCVPAFIIALIANSMVNRAYSKYSKVRNQRGLTGAQAAYNVLMHYGINNVKIERQAAGLLTTLTREQTSSGFLPKCLTETALLPWALPVTRQDTPPSTLRHTFRLRSETLLYLLPE